MDLKPQNILLDSKGTAYIGDVGVAKIFEKTQTTISGRGTPSWMAPEILKSSSIDQYFFEMNSPE